MFNTQIYVDLSILGYRTIELYINGVEGNISHGCHMAAGGRQKGFIGVKAGSMRSQRVSWLFKEVPMVSN